MEHFDPTRFEIPAPYRRHQYTPQEQLRALVPESYADIQLEETIQGKVSTWFRDLPNPSRGSPASIRFPTERADLFDLSNELLRLTVAAIERYPGVTYQQALGVSAELMDLLVLRAHWRAYLMSRRHNALRTLRRRLRDRLQRAAAAGIDIQQDDECQQLMRDLLDSAPPKGTEEDRSQLLQKYARSSNEMWARDNLCSEELISKAIDRRCGFTYPSIVSGWKDALAVAQAQLFESKGMGIRSESDPVAPGKEKHTAPRQKGSSPDAKPGDRYLPGGLDEPTWLQRRKLPGFKDPQPGWRPIVLPEIVRKQIKMDIPIYLEPTGGITNTTWIQGTNKWQIKGTSFYLEHHFQSQDPPVLLAYPKYLETDTPTTVLGPLPEKGQPYQEVSGSSAQADPGEEPTSIESHDAPTFGKARR